MQADIERRSLEKLTRDRTLLLKAQADVSCGCGLLPCRVRQIWNPALQVRVLAVRIAVVLQYMDFSLTSIPGVFIVRPTVSTDDRGFFMEIYHARAFAQAGIDASFVQDNHSGSKQGTLRGLHYQIKQPQAKLVRTIVGEVFDVVVDLRRSSPTFMRWVGAYLSSENRQMLSVPAGFAHGFYALSEWAEIAYKASDFYAPQWERTLAWNDPQVGIAWPLIGGAPPILSAKDAAGRRLPEAETYA